MSKLIKLSNKNVVIDSTPCCPACNCYKEIVSGFGVCEECVEAGYWIDPAGGLHLSDDDDYDPAQMYE